jgi:hypothetical protein
MARLDGVRLVRHRTYKQLLDVTGKDLVSLLNHPKGEITAIVGSMVPKSEMPTVQLPIEAVTSMTGERPPREQA